jgi:hypothetical protein
MFGRNKQPAGNNSGVQNSGTIGGSIQNQPGAIGSHQTQNASGTQQTDLDKLQTLLAQIRAGLIEHRDRIDSYDETVVLFDDAQRRMDDPAARPVVSTLLSEVSRRCGGAPGLVSLITSALSMITTLA